MVAKVQAKYSKAMAMQVQGGRQNIGRVATTLPAVKQYDQRGLRTSRVVIPLQAHALAAIQDDFPGVMPEASAASMHQPFTQPHAGGDILDMGIAQASGWRIAGYW